MVVSANFKALVLIVAQMITMGIMSQRVMGLTLEGNGGMSTFTALDHLCFIYLCISYKLPLRSVFACIAMWSTFM